MTATILSEGTLRNEDVVPALIGYLRTLAPDGEAQADMFEGEWLSDFDAGKSADDLQGEFLDDLYRAIDERLPEGFYVGAHEGDGACIGIFPVPPEPEEEDDEPIPAIMITQDDVAMLNRVLAALETPDDLTLEERRHVIEDFTAFASAMEDLVR